MGLLESDWEERADIRYSNMQLLFCLLFFDKPRCYAERCRDHHQRRGEERRRAGSLRGLLILLFPHGLRCVWAKSNHSHVNLSPSFKQTLAKLPNCDRTAAGDTERGHGATTVAPSKPRRINRDNNKKGEMPRPQLRSQEDVPLEPVPLFQFHRVPSSRDDPLLGPREDGGAFD